MLNCRFLFIYLFFFIDMVNTNLRKDVLEKICSDDDTFLHVLLLHLPFSVSLACVQDGPCYAKASKVHIKPALISILIDYPKISKVLCLNAVVFGLKIYRFD